MAKTLHRDVELWEYTNRLEIRDALLYGQGIAMNDLGTSRIRLGLVVRPPVGGHRDPGPLR